MVVAKIEKIDSHDKIRVVRLPCGHITVKKRCRPALAAEKYSWLLKQVACDVFHKKKVACDDKDLSLRIKIENARDI